MNKKLPSSDQLIDQIDFQTIFSEVIDQPASITDATGLIVFWNKAAHEMYGWTAKEMIGKYATEIIADEIPVQKSKEIITVLSAGRSWTGTMRVKRKDGSTFLASLHNFPIRDVKGKLMGIIGLTTDMTAWASQEKKLEESQDKYQKLFNTMSQGIVYHDKAGKIISANPAAEAILGVQLGKIKGITAFDQDWRVIKEDETSFSSKDFPSTIALETGKKVENVVMGVYNPKQKTYKWLLCSSTPEFEHHSDTPTGAYIIFTDISDQKKAEKDLKERTNEFQNMNQFMIDRELRMTQIKEENAKLKEKLSSLSH
jgi:PAS domain S-box-containing protein